MSGKLNRRNVRQFRALHYVSAISLSSQSGAQIAHGGRDDINYGISYTTILSAMPRRAACFWIGLISRR